MWLQEEVTVTRWAILMLMLGAVVTVWLLRMILGLMYGSEADVIEKYFNEERPPIEKIHRHCIAAGLRKGEDVMVIYRGNSDAYKCPGAGLAAGQD